MRLHATWNQMGMAALKTKGHHMGRRLQDSDTCDPDTLKLLAVRCSWELCGPFSRCGERLWATSPRHDGERCGSESGSRDKSPHAYLPLPPGGGCKGTEPGCACRSCRSSRSCRFWAHHDQHCPPIAFFPRQAVVFQTGDLPHEAFSHGGTCLLSHSANDTSRRHFSYRERNLRSSRPNSHKGTVPERRGPKGHRHIREAGGGSQEARRRLPRRRGRSRMDWPTDRTAHPAVWVFDGSG